MTISSTLKNPLDKVFNLTVQIDKLYKTFEACSIELGSIHYLPDHEQYKALTSLKSNILWHAHTIGLLQQKTGLLVNSDLPEATLEKAESLGYQLEELEQTQKLLIRYIKDAQLRLNKIDNNLSIPAYFNTYSLF